jgi:hypothetical protein
MHSWPVELEMVCEDTGTDMLKVRKITCKWM